MDDDLAVAVTAGYVTGGVVLTLALQRRGHHQMCHVFRSLPGLALWVVLTLHLWVPRADPFSLPVRLYRWARPRR